MIKYIKLIGDDKLKDECYTREVTYDELCAEIKDRLKQKPDDDGLFFMNQVYHIYVDFVRQKKLKSQNSAYDPSDPSDAAKCDEFVNYHLKYEDAKTLAINSFYRKFRTNKWSVLELYAILDILRIDARINLVFPSDSEKGRTYDFWLDTTDLFQQFNIYFMLEGYSANEINSLLNIYSPKRIRVFSSHQAQISEMYKYAQALGGRIRITLPGKGGAIIPSLYDVQKVMQEYLRFAEHKKEKSSDMDVSKS